MAKKINFLLIQLDKKVLRCEDTIALGLSNVDPGRNDDEHAENAVSWLNSEDLVEDFKRDTGDAGRMDLEAPVSPGACGGVVTTNTDSDALVGGGKYGGGGLLWDRDDMDLETPSDDNIRIDDWVLCNNCDKWRRAATRRDVNIINGFDKDDVATCQMFGRRCAEQCDNEVELARSAAEVNDMIEESDDESYTLMEAPKKKRKSGGQKRKKKAGKKKNSNKDQDNKNQVVVEQSDEDAALVQAAIGE